MLSNSGREWNHQEFEETLSHLLKIGVSVAAVVVFLGGVLYLTRHGASLPDYGVFHGEPVHLTNISGIVASAISLQSRGAIQLGLLLLVATPVVRVLFTFLAFARQRDSLYSIMTLLVLAILLYNLTGHGP